MTNTGPTVITGDLGIHPGSVVTGFPPGIVIAGTTHAADAVALQAKDDLVAAYDALDAQGCDQTFPNAADLVGLTLGPGVYCSASSLFLSGTLTLDAQFNPNAVWVFKTGSTLITASASTVRMTNGGQQCNVFWEVGSSATLGTTTTFIGNILALTSISLNTGANVSGRVLARNGSVTMDSNTVAPTACGVPQAGPIPPTVGKAFNPAIIESGGTSTLTITLSNAGADGRHRRLDHRHFACGRVHQRSRRHHLRWRHGRHRHLVGDLDGRRDPRRRVLHGDGASDFG